MNVTRINCYTQRLYNSPHYLVTLCGDITIGHRSDGGAQTMFPMARAVMDDFGDLVLVRGWL